VNSEKNIRKLRFGIPKGSLQESTLSLLNQAGFRVSVSSRSYFPSVDDPDMEIVMFRAQEMSRYVAEGVIDVGLTGSDWIEENGSQVTEVAELVYAKQKLSPVRWVLAVPRESSVQKVEDLEGGLVATELVKVTQRFFASRNVNVKVEFSWGATEVKARLVDAIVDVTETGSSLRANNLRIIETLMTSSTRLIANPEAWKDAWKREKIEIIALMMKGALEAREKVGIKMNVRTENLDKILAILPALRNPTVSALADKAWTAVETIVNRDQTRDIVPKLKNAGAEGIVEYNLNKIIH